MQVKATGDNCWQLWTTVEFHDYSQSVDRAEADDSKPVRVTVDQIVAMNMRYWRRAAGMTQEELGDLIGWSARNVSAAERSADDDRDRRRFDAGTLANLAMALGVPLIAFFLPPADDSPAAEYRFPALPGDPDGDVELTMGHLLSFIALPDSGERTAIMGIYRDRFNSVANSLLDADGAKEVARMLSLVEDDEHRAIRAERLRQREAELRRAAAELADLADAIDPEGDADG